MDKYWRKEKTKEKTPENEIRVTSTTLISNYLRYINTLFTDKKLDTIIIKSTGNAIGKAVNLAEVARRRFKGIHQIAEISTIEIEDEYEPLEEGLDVVKLKRRLTTLNITLTKKEPVNKNLPGYMPPLPESEVQEYKEFRTGKPEYQTQEGEEDFRGRRRFRRGGRGMRRGNRRYRNYRDSRQEQDEEEKDTYYENKDRQDSWGRRSRRGGRRGERRGERRGGRWGDRRGERRSERRGERRFRS